MHNFCLRSNNYLTKKNIYHILHLVTKKSLVVDIPPKNPTETQTKKPYNKLAKSKGILPDPVATKMFGALRVKASAMSADVVDVAGGTASGEWIVNSGNWGLVPGVFCCLSSGVAKYGC